MMIAPLLLLACTALAGPIGYKRDTENVKVGYGIVDLVKGPDFYAVPVAIGNTAANQTVLLKLDTNSPAIWVNDVDNDFCLAYYPFPGIESSNASEWNSFNSDLRNEYLNELAELQQEQNSYFSSALASSASFSAQESLLSQRAKNFQSTISQIQASLTSEVVQFGESYASANSQDFSSLSSALYADIQSQKSRFGALTTPIPAPTQSAHAYVSTIHSAAVTVVSVTQTASASESSVAPSNRVVGAWQQFTSEAANWFSKRDFPTQTFTLSSFTTFASASATYSFDPSATALQSVIPSAKFDFYDAQEYEQIADCSIYGTFNTSKSGSFVSDESIYISDDADEVFGFVGNDTFTIGNLQLSNTSFVVAEFSDSNIGALGFGQALENISAFDSLPVLLANEGLLGKALYSLQLTEYNPQLLLGAVDYNYLSDNITLVPLLNDTESIAITLSSFGISYLTSENLNFSYVDLEIAEGQAFTTLDTTSKGIYLPEDVLYTLASLLNASFPTEYDESLGRYVITVDESTDGDDYITDLLNIDLDFNFQGLHIELPLSDFLVTVQNNNTAYFNYTVASGNAKNESFYLNLNDDVESDYYISEYENDDDDSYAYDYELSNSTQYILSILPSEGDEVNLGLDFLQSVYVVVDLEDKLVGLAPLADWSYDSDYHEDLAILAITDEIPFSVNATFFDDYYGSSNVTSLLV